jgi:hypothetical protein
VEAFVMADLDTLLIALYVELTGRIIPLAQHATVDQVGPQGLGKVRACLVGDGRVSEGLRDARCVGHEEAGP